MPEQNKEKLTEFWARVLFQRIRGCRLLLGTCARCGVDVKVNYELASEAAAGREQVLCRECDPPPLIDKAMVLTPRQRAGCKRTRS